MQKIYCPDVYKSMYLRKIDDQQVDVGFCCVNQLDTAQAADLQTVLQAKRHAFASELHSKQCQHCWSAERFGVHSRRTQDIVWFQNNAVDMDQNVQLLNLEWNCENICNLACVTCGPVFSSRWSAEVVQYPWHNGQTYRSSSENKIYQSLDFSHLRRVYFNGGEPLLSTDHKEILRQIQSAGALDQCEVCYNTNATVMPDAETLELWSQAKLVRIFLSIDAIESQFEFIRWPGKWWQVLDFLQVLGQQPFNIMIDITCTVGIHNVFELHKIHQWHLEQLATNHQGDAVTLNIQPCDAISHGGRVLKLENASRDLAKVIMQYLTQLKIDTRHLQSLCARANGDDHNWVQYLSTISARRNLDWRYALSSLDLALDSIKDNG